MRDMWEMFLLMVVVILVLGIMEQVTGVYLMGVPILGGF